MNNINIIGNEFEKPFKDNWVKLQTTNGRKNLTNLLLDILDNDDISIRKILIKTDNTDIRDALNLITIYITFLLTIHDNNYRIGYDLLYNMYVINIESEIYWNERRTFRGNRDDDVDVNDNGVHHHDEEDNVDNEEEEEEVDGYGDDIDDGSYEKFRRRR
jgi:hypothetical protein